MLLLFFLIGNLVENRCEEDVLQDIIFDVQKYAMGFSFEEKRKEKNIQAV